MNDTTHCPNCGTDLTAIAGLGTIEYRLSITSTEMWRSQLLPNGEIDTVNAYLADDYVADVGFLEAVCRKCGAPLPNVKA